MVTTKLNLSMTEPQVRQIYAKQGDTGRVLDITLDQTPEDGTLRILRPDGVEVTSDAVTGGEVESGGTFESLTEADVTELSVGIEPVQDLNGYDHPWVGGAGTNIYDDSAKTNALINEQGAETTNTAWYLSDYCAIPLGTTKVTLSWQSEMTYYQGRVVAYDSSKAFISGSYVAWAGTAQSHTFDVPSTASFVRVNYSHVVNSQESPRNNVRLNVGTSDLGYAPYSNICPITGHDEVRVTRTGKNLLDPVVFASGRSRYYNVNSDGSINVVANDSTAWNNVPNIPLKAGTYTLSWVTQPSGQLRMKTSDDGYSAESYIGLGNKRYTFTLTDDGGIKLKIGVYATYPYTEYLQLELGSTATSYEPYNSNTYTTSLGQTVYGGTLDMVTGVLTVDKGYVEFDGDANENWSLGAYGNENYRAYIAVSGIDTTVEDANVADIASNQFSAISYFAGGSATGISSRKNIAQINVFQSAISTVTSWREHLATNPLQVVYKLANPVTYQLTAQQIKTLVGTNNVWASSGDIVNIKFTYSGLLSELPSDATSIVGKCYCDVEQNGVSSMPFTLNIKKNERQ